MVITNREEGKMKTKVNTGKAWMPYAGILLAAVAISTYCSIYSAVVPTIP
jgi:hypothetical protein